MIGLTCMKEAGRRSLGLHHQLYARAAYSSTSVAQDRLVVAVGGNALQRRGERLTIANMLKAAAEMAPTIAELSKEHEVVLCHGNGPQVGELALERSAASFDVVSRFTKKRYGYHWFKGGRAWNRVLALSARSHCLSQPLTFTFVYCYIL